MFAAAKPWRGSRGGRRTILKVLTLSVLVALFGLVVSVSMVIVAAAMPSGGFASAPYMVGTDPISQLAVGLFTLWLIFGIIALVLTLVAWKGMHMKWKVGAVALTTLFLGLVLIGALEQVPTAPGTTSGGPTPTPLTMVITPAVQTSDQLASPFTAATSQLPLSSNGAKTVAGYVWAAASGGTGAIYNAQGATNGQFIDYCGDQVAVTGGGGKVSANCGTVFEMKFTFAYTNAPSATGGGSVFFPVYVFLTGVSYSAPAPNLNNNPFNQQYSNGTLVNVPILASSLVGLGAFPVTAKDGAGNQQQVCPNLQNANVQFATALPSCSGMNVNQNPTTNAITFYVIVSSSAAGLFGYATSDAAIGSSITFTFQVGLPQANALPAYPGYYTPTLAQYTLTIQRTVA